MMNRIDRGPLSDCESLRRNCQWSVRNPKRASSVMPAACLSNHVHSEWSNYVAGIRRLARCYGIHNSFIDMSGHRQEATPDTLKALLNLWNVSAKNHAEVRDALHEHKSQQWRQRVPPVLVAWGGNPLTVQMRFQSGHDLAGLKLRLKFEDGQTRVLTSAVTRARKLRTARVGGLTFVVLAVSLPALRTGYHELEVELAGRIDRTLIVSAPAISYSPPGSPKTWGVFLPMYAVHSARSWGAGNLSDYTRLSEWAGSLGGSVVATLPLLAAFLDTPVCEPSPYSPASRLFWNEFYLDLTAVPEFSRSRAAQKLVNSLAFQKRLQEFRNNSLVDYRAEMAARRQVLELLAHDFFAGSSPRRQQCERFMREKSALLDYAQFRAACDYTRTSWHQWEERMRYGKLQSGDYSNRVKDYHVYVQWLAQEQLGHLLNDCRKKGAQFYLDLPLGVHPDGYDIWRERDAFASPASAGAPPDPVFTKGQNWGFAPLHPQRIQARGYCHVRDYLRFQMRHTGMLRMDHVMGLHRLFWIPHGFPASRGAYVSYPAEELYAILSLESHRHQTILVGENLGTVPPEVNVAMTRHGLRPMFVLQYELRPNPKQSPPPPPSASVASLNTHDMPPFAAYLRAVDIEERAKLGLVRNLQSEKEQREQQIRALVEFLKRCGSLQSERPDESAIINACLAWLSTSSASVVLVNLEDLWGEFRSQNMPGTSNEKPNWRRKARFTLERILTQPQFLEALQRIDRLRKESAVMQADK